uniref:Retrotransposon protein, putative, LINE subclass n=1 Tax=Oryza sativa subsp. japonica TaxID=39947 RepID=Q339P9_ORYSJ|nr:retrotransposon protein, putative, LINE subclass [Oryza sativa Japonica Group]
MKMIIVTTAQEEGTEADPYGIVWVAADPAEAGNQFKEDEELSLKKTEADRGHVKKETVGASTGTSLARSSREKQELEDNQWQETQASPVRGEQQVDAFIADLSTPLQQPLLPAPGEKQRRLCRNKVTISVQHQSARLATKARQNSKFESFAQEILANKFGVLDDNKRLDARIKSLYLQQYKKPLSPAAVKTIAALETKLDDVSDSVMLRTLGGRFVRSYAYLPADGSRGGILLACDDNYFSISDITLRQYSLSATITMKEEILAWSITVVYGPQLEEQKLPDFMEVTAQSWNRPIGATNPLAKFHLKLCRLGRDLKRWSRTHVGDIKLRLAIANEVIFQLEVAQESRILSDEEYQLRKDLKLKDQKMIELNRFFNLRLGVPGTRLNRLNWARINLPSVDLSELEADFDEEEIKDAILNLAPEKAPGPDGFTGAFFNCSSRILLNGIPGDHIFHARGLRQGDPLSPMLFILVMEPLHQIIKAAEDANIISNLCQRQGRFRCSLYADDVALFALPTEDELIALKRILLFFAQISCLHTNMSKTEIYPISCSDIDLDNILTFFPGNKKNFPCKYLGLPLHTRKLKKIDLQPLVDKIGSRIKDQGSLYGFAVVDFERGLSDMF